MTDPALLRRQAYVDGSWTDADSGEVQNIRNPANGRPVGTVPVMGAAETRRAIAGSLPFGLYHQQRQIGFARLITDYTRFGWLCDVMIDENWRGHGLGSWLATCVREHPELQTVHRWMLSTQDAHQVYQRLGWRVVQHPEALMEFPPS